MSSQDFPTYGRGENHDESREDEHFAKPAPYGGHTFAEGTYADPTQPGAYQAPPQPGPYQPQPGQPGVPGQPGQQQPPYDGGAPSPYGEAPAHSYNQPPAYRPGNPYGPPANPQPHELPTYGREAVRDPRAARVVLLATIIAAVYGLLVISVQRVSLREISQLPGSPLNHPLRTDAIDTIGQLLTLVVGLAALGMWLRDLMNRRKAGRQPDPIELGGLGLVAVSLIPLLIWLVMILSTGMGSIDDSLHRLPTAYAWGGTGLLILAVGFALGYRELKPEVRESGDPGSTDPPTLGVTVRVVLVPGLGLGPESYAPTVEHLHAQYEVVTLPGYGEPVHEGDDLRTEALAQRVVDRLTEPSVLVGHSASCQIVVAAALARPELTKGLVLLGPTGDVSASDWPTLAARWIRSAVWESPQLVPVLAPQYARTGLLSMARAMEVARRYDLAAAIRRLERPVVVVRCEHDSLCPPDWAQRVAELSGGTAWTLPTGSHMPVLTNGAEVVTFIKRAAGVYNGQ